MAIRRVREIDADEELRKSRARLNPSNIESYAAVVDALTLPTGITAVNSSSVYYDASLTTQGMSSNNMLFISQQIGRNSSGTLATGITNQATQALTNMSNILTQAGLSTSNVAHVTMYLTSSSNYSSAIAVFKSVFSTNPPAFDYAAMPNIVSAPSGVLVAFDAYAYTAGTPSTPSLVSNSWPKDSTTVASVGWNPSRVCGDLVFSAMQVAVDPSTGTLTSGTAVDEFNQAMQNLENTIIAAGSNLDKTCRVVLHVTALSYWSDILTLYDSYFVNAPAREMFTVSALPYGGKVGISIISAISGTPSSFNVSGVNSYVPFSQVTTCGNFAYVSNIIGTNSSGTLPSNVGTQASNIMSNLQTIMSNAGVIGLSNPYDYALRVVLTATTTTNMNTLVTAYQGYFTNSNKPALVCSFTSAAAIYNSAAVSCDVILYKP